MEELVKTVLAGVVGGIAIYYIPRILKRLQARRKPILTYYFFDHRKDGEDQRRRISHSYGKAINDQDAIKGSAWEHTSDQLEPGGLATCYGPYTKEISERGKYRAKFRIKALGVKSKDEPILTLDVAYGTREGKDLMIVGLPLMERDLKGSDFKDGRYQEFHLDFDYDGQHLLEFRCLVKNPKAYQQRVNQLILDRVAVYRLHDIL